MPKIPVFTGSESKYEAALKWAGAGWYVLRVAGGTKSPASAGGRWEETGTRDPETLRRWFDSPAGERAGLGLCPGPSGAFIMDVDKPELFDLPAPPKDAVHIPSRPDDPSREHLFFAQPPGRELGCPKVDWGDTRGWGGFLMAYPSLNPDSGQPYPPPPPEFQGKDLPALPHEYASQWRDRSVYDLNPIDLEDAYRELAGREWQVSDDRLTQLIVDRFRDDILNGKGRHTSLIHYLTWGMKAGYQGKIDPDDFVTVMRREWRELVLYGPHAREEWQAVAEFDRAVVYAVQTAQAEAAGTILDAPERDDARKDESANWVLTPVEELEDRPRQPELVEDTLTPTGVAHLVGETFTGKSYIAIDLVLSIATDAVTHWFGRRILSHGGAAYWLLEGEYDFGLRVAAWKHHHGHTPNHPVHLLTGPGGVTVPAERDRMIHVLRETYGPNLAILVVDTQSLAFSELDENSNTEMGRMLVACKDISRQLGCLVLLVHHASDKGEDGPRRNPARGASAQKAGMDIQLHVLRPPNEPGKIQLVKYKPWKPWDSTEEYSFLDVTLPPAPDGSARRSSVIVQQDTSLRYLSTPDTPAHHAADLQILRALAEADHGMHLREIAEVTGLPYNAVNNAVSQRLKPRSLVAQPGKKQPYTLTLAGYGELD